VDVAAIKRQVTRREVAFQVAQAYYRLLEAQRLTEVARTSVTQLEAQQREAQSLFDNGVIGKNDLLRAGLALASAKQREIQMRGNVILGRGQLAVLLGEPPGAEIEPEPFAGDPPGNDEPNVAAAETRAVAQRLEVRALDRGIDQADHGVAAAKKKLIPQVNATGNYTHFEGSQFQQENAAFVGLFASWDVWDWGTTTSGISSANAKLDQARIARKKLDDQVRLEARQAFVNAETAREALGVARTAVSQAEENFRIVTKKFQAAAATSFDVVDAEALLTQARGQVETGLYDLLIARAALARATGTPLPGER
jgi:outer membrane protein TolC